MPAPASPATVDVESLLQPIPGDDPSGESLAYSPEYDQIREARRADEVLNQGEWKRELKVADWDLVVEIATDALANKTKDLQIAAWLTEALNRLHGFAGLRDGLLVLKGIQERFWETYHPQIEDGDPESRLGPFLFLNDKARGLPLLIRTTPITRGVDDQEYTLFQHAESRETDNLIKKDPSKEKQILAGGRLTVKQFDDAVAQTPKLFYWTLSTDLAAARAALKAFAEDSDEKFGRDAPSLLEVEKALDEVARIVEPILAAKRAIEPDPIEIPEAPPEVEGTATTADAPAESTANGATSHAATDGTVHFDGVPVPRRRSRLGTPQEAEAPDFGRVLIDFKDRAAALAEAGVKLTENRQKYAELLAELKRLDDEYEELSAVVSRNREAYQLLARLLRV